MGAKIEDSKIKNEGTDLKGVIECDAMVQFIEKAQLCICEIRNEKENKKGSGFFCKIPYTRDDNTLLNVLLTCEHVLGKNLIFSDENIQITLNNNKKYLSLKQKRKKWSSHTMDFSFIEILENDGIEDYYRIDDEISKNSIIMIDIRTKMLFLFICFNQK